MPSQLPSNLWLPPHPNPRPLHKSNPLQHLHLPHRLSHARTIRFPNLYLPNQGERTQQFLSRQRDGKHRSPLLWPKHAHHSPSRSIRLSRSHPELFLAKPYLRTIQPQTPYFDFNSISMGSTADQSNDMRSWSSVRVNWCYERLCVSLYTATCLLVEADYERRLGTVGCEGLRGFWVCCDGYQLGASCDQNGHQRWWDGTMFVGAS